VTCPPGTREASRAALSEVKTHSLEAAYGARRRCERRCRANTPSRRAWERKPGGLADPGAIRDVDLTALRHVRALFLPSIRAIDPVIKEVDSLERCRHG